MAQRRFGWAGAARSALAGGLMLTSCSAVDTFGSRTVTYNRQMQQARRELIIENILRAGYDQPLQFSEVSTVTGQASIQGSIGGDLPLFGPRGAQMPRLFSFSPGLQASGGPSFTVGNLDTQEFLSGIIAPVRPDIIQDYLQIGYGRATLLSLLISSITFKRDGTNYVFINDGRKPDGHGLFMQLLDALIAQGLTFETVERKVPVGPLLNATDVRSERVLGTLLAAGPDAPLSLATVPAATGGKAGAGAAETYRLTRTERAPRFCMLTDQKSLHDVLNGAPQAPEAPVTVAPFKLDDQLFVMHIGPADQCDTPAPPAAAVAAAAARDPAMITDLVFTSRSVRGVFAYLGAVARHELDAGNPALFDRRDPSGRVRRVFGIEAAQRGRADASFDDHDFRTTRGGADDDTDRSIQLLSELMALYSAAKSFPAPSVLPIITR